MEFIHATSRPWQTKRRGHTKVVSICIRCE